MLDQKLFDFPYCACSNLRGASRVMTQAYEKLLEPSGLTITQFGVLVGLAKIGPASINQLGEFLVMDPTTLNRHLKPLLEQKLAETRPGEDRRYKLVTMTGQGRTALDVAVPLWNEAQNRVIEAMGQERFENFLKDLHFVQKLIG